jgi:hypothetical protein
MSVPRSSSNLLDYRQEARRQQFRFRKHPEAYLALLEARLLQRGFPFRGPPQNGKLALRYARLE